MAGQPAAVAAGVLALIWGMPTAGVVLGSLSKAVIIEVDTCHGPRVISLLDRAAAGVPNGVRIPGNTGFNAIRPGDSALIGERKVEVGPLSLRMVRSWDSRVRPIRPDPERIARLGVATDAVQRGVGQYPIDRLHTALSTGREVPAAIDALVGLGQGLTPGGDDVIAGLLTALHAVGRAPLARRIGDRALRNRTTTLSTDLLRLARDGHACLEALAVLRAMQMPAGPVSDVFHRLLSIGHTSGADLATGMTIGLQMREGL